MLVRTLAAVVTILAAMAAIAQEDLSLGPITPKAFASAVTADDLDTKASGARRGTASLAVTAADMQGLLGLPGKPVSWGMNDDLRKVKDAPVQYLLVFKKPIALGTIHFAGSPRNLRILKPDAALPADPNKADAWIDVELDKRQSGAPMVALPPKTQTAAILFTDEKNNDWSSLSFVRLYRSRLHNVTPTALAYAESEWASYSPFGPPFVHAASIITSGSWGHWQNTGPDNKGRTPRAPVSDVSPSWFMLTWKQPQTIVGFYLQDNFEQLSVQYYNGPESINPRAGTDKEWRLIRQEMQAAPGGHLVMLEKPLATRGLRLNILKTAHGPVAKLLGCQMVVDLKDAPTPPAVSAVGPAAELPPVRMGYEYDFDGTVTAVINDAQGRRVRNLFAREVLKKGKNELAWDLKDDAGIVVPPGHYEWKTIAGPPLGLRYEMTAYPNVHDNSPDNPPWHTSMSGNGGWLADHTSNKSGAASGPYVFFGAPVAESGVSMAACDLTGKKLWAVPSFAGFTGAYFMAADDKTVFVVATAATVAGEWHVDPSTEPVWAVDIATHQVRDLARLEPTSSRKRGVRGLAARDNKLYLSVGVEDDWFATSASPADVDIEKCFPRFAPRRKPRYPMELVPDPRNDFMRLFRLTSTPPGEGLVGSLNLIESTPGKSSRRHVVLAFTKPVAVGSVVLPASIDKDVKVKLSFLKPDAAFPPNPGDPKLWAPFEVQPTQPWDAAIAPKGTATRAIRVTFTRGADDIFADSAEANVDEYSTTMPTEGLEVKPEEHPVLDEGTWTGKLEGMKIIGRRFQNVADDATVTVNSGKVAPDGTWDAQRTKPVTPDDPAIYCMQWKQPQSLRGLAIKEVDGRRVEVDVFTGEGAIDPAASKGWQNVKTYTQSLRTAYMGSSNVDARYLDGYVDFGRELTVRAVRLRVVEPILDLSGEHVLRADAGRDKVNPVRCRIFGVAALKYLGGEAATAADPLMYNRIEVLNGATGKIDQEIAIKQAGPIAFNAAGELFAISGKDLVKVDLAAGQVKTVVAGDLVQPQAMAIDKAGNVYVYDQAADRRNIRVYDVAKGQMVRTIGTPGGYVAGAWDPTRFNDIHALVIDSKDQLWAVDNTYFPKRISQWTTAGSWQKDFLGNTCYGGAGVLDPFDKKRLYWGPMEFELDWQTGKTRLKNLTWVGDTRAGDVPTEINGKRYMTTRFEGGSAYQSAGIVYLHEKDHLKLAAAVGRAEGFAPLKYPQVQAGLLPKLAGKALSEMNFHWSDLNSDGKVQADEVTFLPRAADDSQIGTTNFNRDLGVQQGTIRYQVKQFLPSGVPVYEVKQFPNLRGMTLYRMDSGNFHTMGNNSNETLMTPEGKPVWTYYAEGWTTHGYAAAGPYWPGQVVAQFYMAGHETAHAGDLGEFFVINTNMGCWNLWTADGMLAGWIFNDQRNPGLRNWTMPEHNRGMKLDDVTIGQEHFNAYFCRTSDNHYYAVAGHNHMSIVEVLGLEKFKRLSGKLEVTPEAIAKTAKWEAGRQKEKLYDRTPVLDCFKIKTPPRIDGDGSDFAGGSVEFGQRSNGELKRGAEVRMSWDDKNVYVFYLVAGLGPMKNSGEQWDRLFKTGAAVDLQIGTDPAADPGRAAPVAGDKRLLMTFTGKEGKPTAVLYEAVVPDTPADKAWKAVSPISSVSFDRVRVLENVQLKLREAGDYYYSVGATIPLEVLGLKPAENVRLKFDWGAITTDANGNSVMRRMYWANKATAIIADVPSEARLQPDLWGWVLFHEGSRRDAAEMSEVIDDEGKINKPSSGGLEEDALKGLEDDIKEDLKDK